AGTALRGGASALAGRGHGAAHPLPHSGRRACRPGDARSRCRAGGDQPGLGGRCLEGSGVMKIAGIEVFFLRHNYADHLRYQFTGGRVETLDLALIRVTSEAGEYGLGELTFGQFTYEPIIGLVAHFDRLLRGHPIKEITRAWELMYRSSAFWNRAGLGIAVMGGINMAMYDLLGKTLGVPVHELLGGVVRPRARVYASNGLFDAPGRLVADVKRAQGRGFDAYKLRVISTVTVVDHVTAFRDTVGSSMDLMV